ncbi:MAG: helix-turn-helix transcriptional regulator [Prochloraceae cyanobacterium]
MKISLNLRNRLKLGLSEWLFIRRRKLGLTQKEIAAELGVTTQTISNWETSRAIPTLTIGQIKRLCQMLECNLEDIPSEGEIVEV